MSKRLGLAGILLLMIGVGIWAVLPKHGSSPKSGANSPVTKIPVRASLVPGSLGMAKPAAVSTFGIRPAATVAARNARRVRFAVLKTLGASDQVINRLTDGDIKAVIQELKQQARQGDATAGNILYRMVRFDCAFARMHAARPDLQEAQLREAQTLSSEDADWLKVAIQEKSAADQRLADGCNGADRSEAEALMMKAADDGNAGSLYLRYLFKRSQTMSLSRQQLQEAVDAGFPDAQAFLAQSLANGAPGFPSSGEGSDNLFRLAAAGLPYAESLLAICEFSGCAGVEVDISSAVAHAREAAQRGNFDAMMQIGPKLQASQIDPTEVAAWSLVSAVLAQQGCSSDSLSVQNMTSWTSALTSKPKSNVAKSLAEDYWRDYGSQMMTNIGCSS